MEWISVDNGLPEYNTDVSVIYVDDKNRTHGCTGILHKILRQYNNPKSAYDNKWYVVPSIGHQIKVTHWQPLPDPPKIK